MKKLTKKLVMLAVFGLIACAVNAQTWNIGTPTATDVTATLRSVQIRKAFKPSLFSPFGGVRGGLKIIVFIVNHINPDYALGFF